MGNGIKPEHIYREVKSHRSSPYGNPCAEDQATQCIPQSAVEGIDN